MIINYDDKTLLMAMSMQLLIPIYSYLYRNYSILLYSTIYFIYSPKYYSVLNYFFIITINEQQAL